MKLSEDQEPFDVPECFAITITPLNNLGATQFGLAFTREHEALTWISLFRRRECTLDDAWNDNEYHYRDGDTITLHHVKQIQLG